jgi:hypothetical protein
MALMDIAIRNARPTGKPYKLTDEKGLYPWFQRPAPPWRTSLAVALNAGPHRADFRSFN